MKVINNTDKWASYPDVKDGMTIMLMGTAEGCELIKVPKEKPRLSYQEAYLDKLKKEQTLSQLCKQISSGCGKAGCKNMRSCLSANKALHSMIGLPQNDKYKVLTKAIEMQIKETYKMCEDIGQE